MATGLQFFNHKKLGFLPLGCWGEECELEPKLRGKHFDRLSGEFFAPDRRSTPQNRANYAYEIERREEQLNPEEELLAREAEENDPDFGVLDDGTYFSVPAAINLASELGYSDQRFATDEDRLDPMEIVIGHYLSERPQGIRGMDGLIEFLIKERPSINIWAAAINFTKRIAKYNPDVSVSSRESLIKTARRFKPAVELGLILFGRAFRSWVERQN